MELNKRSVKTLLGIVAFGVLLHWGLQNFSQIAGIFRLLFGLILPFLVGGCIAFILNTPMRRIEGWLFPAGKGGRAAAGLRRPVSITLTLLLVAGVLTVVTFLIIPELGRSMDTIRAGIPGFVSRAQEWSAQLSAKWPEIAQWLDALEVDWKEITQSLFGFLQNGAGSLLSSTISIAASIFSVVFTMILGMVFALYILAQKEKLAAGATNLLYAYLPACRADRVLEVARLTNRTFASFLSGQFTEAFILGMMFFVSMSVLGFPFALMISVLVGVTALIPVFGAFIGCFVGVFVIAIQDPLQALGFLVLFLVLQQIEGNLIYPKVVGNSVGLPSIWVLVAVTIGGSAMGVVGMLIFIPLCSVFYALVKESVARRLDTRGIRPAGAPKRAAEPPREEAAPQG